MSRSLFMGACVLVVVRHLGVLGPSNIRLSWNFNFGVSCWFIWLVHFH
jgi:hypothetical protein